MPASSVQAGSAGDATPVVELDRPCRFCGTQLTHTFADLGMSPVSNAFREPEDWNTAEVTYPLRALICPECLLVQLEEFETRDGIFNHDYAYFSSYSNSWLDHARRYAEAMIERFGLGADSLVVELASNDGYLLRWFKERGVGVLGIEPSGNVAAAAEEIGIPSVVRFFGVELARELTDHGRHADLIPANNVLAHVPDVNDFVGGMKILLAPGGVVTVEFPHLLRLMLENQFDTIYHEHFSYYSLLTVERIFAAHGLTLFDVEELPTHGGSLRIYARHTGDEALPVGPRIEAVKALEREHGLDRLETYLGFEEQVEATKRRLLAFLIEAREAGKTVVGYGAPAKGNTLLNYCGVRTDFLEYTVDRSPRKQGRFLPGTQIPIYGPEKIDETRPDYVLILPWNLKDEISASMAHVREWGGRFVVPIPQVQVLD